MAAALHSADVIIPELSQPSHPNFESSPLSHTHDVVSETDQVLQKQELEAQVKCLEKCSIEIIDGTVLIDPETIVNGDTNIENIGKAKEKRFRRRGKNWKNKDSLLNSCYVEEKREKKGFVYSRKEMEALMFEDLEEQKKKWVEVYCGLGPVVTLEYDGLAKCEEKQENVVDFDPRPQLLRASNLVGKTTQLSANVENTGTSDLACSLPGSDEMDGSILEEECSQDYDSDEDYSSIQKPAFYVAGEPDFDSGPPQDGLEFLRRVRWEAAQIPKVKVSKAGKTKEQTPYMPQIPDIVKCPENLLPLKEWEDNFLADFSELRLGISKLEFQGSDATKSLSILEDANLDQVIENAILENLNNSTSLENQATCIIDSTSITINGQSQEKSGITNKYPTLSEILKTDFAARNSMLRKRISSMENMTTFSRDDCLWLFALCVIVDTPLDADTCAALRSLLRKCAVLRAMKTEVDDEVVMLNILSVISGRYFGQAEK